MAEIQPYIVDDATDAKVFVPGCRLEQVSIPVAKAEVGLLGPGLLVLEHADPVTGRVIGAPQWVLRYTAVNDARAWGMHTRRLKSKFLSWWGRSTELRLAASDLLDLDREVLDPETAGSTAYKVYRSQLCWWDENDSGFEVRVDGVVTASGFTADYDAGKLTFAAAQDSDAVVEVTIQRRPKVTITAVDMGYVNGTYPVRYGPLVTFREVESPEGEEAVA